MKTINLILLLSLADCQFDYFGRTNQNNNVKQQSNIYLSPTGEMQACVSDEQCNDGLVCFKQNSDNYLGVCAKVNN